MGFEGLAPSHALTAESATCPSSSSLSCVRPASVQLRVGLASSYGSSFHTRPRRIRTVDIDA